MRRVYYSEHKKDSIDLVFFVNGLPVKTAPLHKPAQSDLRLDEGAAEDLAATLAAGSR